MIMGTVFIENTSRIMIWMIIITIIVIDKNSKESVNANNVITKIFSKKKIGFKILCRKINSPTQYFIIRKNFPLNILPQRLHTNDVFYTVYCPYIM